MNVRLPKRLLIAAAITAVTLMTRPLLCAPAVAQVAQQKDSTPLLPADFSGWHLNGSLETSSDPVKADSSIAGPLKEYGFQEEASGAWTRDEEKLSLKALRFGDATGAYGAYTFYRHAGWPKEDIGAGAVSAGNRVLFWTGNVVVDATFGAVTAMSVAEMRQLATLLPKPSGRAALAPFLPNYLPQRNLQTQSTKYALGPDSYSHSGGVLPAELAGFDKGGESITAGYGFKNGDGQLTLLMYPTPQIAGDRERAINGWIKSEARAGQTDAVRDSNPQALMVRRSGPLVAVTSGSFRNSDAESLLGQVNYRANVTVNRPEGYVSEASKTARLLLGIFSLSSGLIVAAIVLGLAFGGGRILLRKMQGKPATTLEENELIRLDLSGSVVEADAGQTKK